jgi:hypothetical protein
MPDPHPLYVVTAIVVLGLVAWVAVVLSRPATEPIAEAAKKKSPPTPAQEPPPGETSAKS